MDTISHPTTCCFCFCNTTVETVVRDRAGEVLTPDIVTRALYGELSGQAFTQAKTHVGKTLWSGANQGRWQSVPGKLGAYTLSLEAR